jgi:hypothetical protein
LGFLLWAGTAASAIAGTEKDQKGKPAEQPHPVLVGTVWSADDRPVGGVTVTIRRASEKKVRWEKVTSPRGEFFQELPGEENDYVVAVILKGQKQPALERTVHVAQGERLDISLHLKE